MNKVDAAIADCLRFAVAYLDTIGALPQLAMWSAGSARARNAKHTPGANPAIGGAFQPGLVVTNSYFSLRREVACFSPS
jgi:hypothetical protein